jgi:hypothetical protein
MGQLSSFVLVSIIVFGVSLGVAALLSSPLRRRITVPILALSEFARAVAERKDYSVRAPASGNDEVTVLSESLNRMLERLEEQTAVAKRNEELIEANRELESFTYSVAHDLRAPLRHLEAFSKILLEGFLDTAPKEARVYLEGLRKGSRKMSHLVDDLLNLALVGRQPLNLQKIPLNDLIWSVIPELRAEAMESGRTVEWRVDLLPEVDCDPGLMDLVFRNLLSNALKYSRPRSPAIIEVGCQSIAGEQAIFVRDNGVGFNMKHAGKLFGVFQRLHRAEEFEGTGVGLATVQHIVRKHGGRVWAEAEPDKGATFYFTLPGPGAAERLGGEVVVTA